MNPNNGIFVRCTDELLSEVDEFRGNRTRPEFARRAMERVIEGEKARRQAAEIVDPVAMMERATGRKPPLNLPPGVTKGAGDVEPRFKK